GDDEGGGRRRGGRREKEKKSLLVPMLGLVALLAVGGGAGWFLMNADKEAAKDKGTGEVAAADNNAGDAAADSAASGDALDATDGGGATDDGGDVAAATSDDSAATDAGGDDAGANEEPVVKDGADKPATPKVADPKDPASVDLSWIPDYGPIAGCSADRFAELQELVATMVDPMAGAAGNRAKTALEKAGKEAFPAILNALKTLDLAEDDPFRSADVCQKALQNICNGNNFGWKYPSQDPESYEYFDKRVIESWAKQWEKAKDSDEYWAKLAKLDKVEGGDAPKDDPGAKQEKVEDDLDALDDM
ncbi:MAG: hypothetical protein H6828_15435, partial [Planctomycetes bacterium]|nr:hypothetical protein [Planctomycetota bacterium]